MPTILDKNQEEEQTQQESQGQENLQAIRGSTSQAGASTSQPTSGGSFAGREGTRSGRFTNLQNYMRGNVKGSRQTTEQITGQAQQKAQKAEQGIQTEQDRIDTGLQDIQHRAEQEQSEAKQALENLTNRQDNNNFRDQFQQQQKELQEGIDTREQTRQDLEGFNLQNEQQRLSDAQEAEEYATAITSESGRQEALKRLAGRPTYTRGQSALDTALTGTGENLEQIKQARADVESKQLSQRNQELAANLEQQKSDVMQAVELGLVDPGEAEGLIEAINREAQSIKGSLEQQGADLISQVERADTGNSILGSEIKALEQALGNRVVDTGVGVGVRMGTVGGEEIILPMERYLELARLPGGNRFLDTVANLPSKIGLQNINPEDAVVFNALTRMSGRPEEEIGQDLIAGAELENLDNLQALSPEDLVSYQSSTGELQKELSDAQQADFKALGALKGDVALADHYSAHIYDAVKDWLNDDTSADAMRAMLKPDQLELFNRTLEFNRQVRERPNMGRDSVNNFKREFERQYGPVARFFKDIAAMARENMRQRQGITDVLRNMYGQGISYEDLINELHQIGDGGRAVKLF